MKPESNRYRHKRVSFLNIYTKSHTMDQARKHTVSRTFIASCELARIAGISKRKAQLALRRSLEGFRWRSFQLVVDVVPGRGGRSGKQYIVALDSLPPELQAKWLAENPLPAVPEPRFVPEGRGRRSDRGERRVVVSRIWDGSVPFDEAAKGAIAKDLRRYVRSLWAAGVPGRRHARRLATAKLAALTRKAGHDLPDAELLKLCSVPEHFVRREKKYSVLATKDKDAKAYADRQPRIRRDHGGLAPMELVIGDVHPVDIYYRRDDGSLATPKLIAWLDAANNRLLGHLVFLEKSKGVRKSHVALSFAHMVLAWGMPGCLYLDNGGEYNWAEFAADAMQLTQVHGDKGAGRPIVKALPYNAAAKKIEGIFAVLERGPFAMIPGWVGGNRMAKKTQNVGREPKPFPGAREVLYDEVQRAIAYYNATAQDGELDGRSPDQVFALAVDSGWQPVAAEMADLEAAFAREEVRTVKQGGFRLDGQLYTHDALFRRPWLQKVRVRIPIFGVRERLAVYGERGAFLCHAEPEQTYHPLDTAGARESARRKRLAAEGVEALRSDVDPVELTAEMAAFVALNTPTPQPAPAGALKLTAEHERAAEDRRRLGPERKRIEKEQSQRDRETWRALAGNLKLGTGG